MIEGATREETVRLTAAALRISELEAEFIVAIELGEIDGDIVFEPPAKAGRQRPFTPPQTPPPRP